MNEPPDASMKQCPKCEQFLPATPEVFDRDRSKRDGLHTVCKTCSKAHKKAYRESHKDLIYQQKKRDRELHKVHIAAHKKQYQQSEVHKAYQKRYHQEHAEELHKYKRQQYEIHAEERREYSRLYLRTEQGRLVDKAHRHKRRAQKRASKGNYTPQQLQEQICRQKSKCYYCKAKLGKIYHADHIVPLSRGGSNDIHNIVVTCPTCNLRKKGRLPHEWPEGNRLL